MSRLAPFASVLALLMAASSAQAATPSAVSAELTALRIQVVDLTPADGIAPSLLARPGGHIQAGLQVDTKWLLSDTNLDQRFTFDTFAAAPPTTDDVVSISIAGIDASARRTGDGLFASATGNDGLSSQSVAWWGTQRIDTTAPDGTSQWAGSFQLGAGTALTLTADYRAFASIAAGNFGGAVIATATLHGFVGTTVAGLVQRDYGMASINAPGEQTETGTLTLTLSNPSATAVPVYFGAHAYTYTEAAAAVPEPATLLMLLAGGVLVAARVRRG